MKQMNTQHPLEYTRQQVNARKSDYVCIPCGRQFLREAQLSQSRVVTCHEAPCGLCGRVATVAHIRSYNHLWIEDEGCSADAMA
jgi:DNA-directed RNA polymerase subunit RPC12/RpoP